MTSSSRIVSEGEARGGTKSGTDPRGYPKFRIWALGLAVAALLPPVLTAAYVGRFSRYLADDFCTLGSLRQLGFWGSQAYWYMHWSGRFSFTFLVNVAEWIGPQIVPILPALGLILLSLSLALVFRTWLAGRPSHRLASAAFGLVVIYETIAGTPNLYQSVFWQTGLLTYVVPLISISFFAAWVQRQELANRSTLPILGLAACWAFVSVGFSETVGSVIVSALLGALILVGLLMRSNPSQPSCLRLLAAGLLGGLLGMVVVAAAPGNAVRQSLLAPSTNLLAWLYETFRNAYIFSVKTYRADPVRVALGLLLPFFGSLTLVRRDLGMPVRLADAKARIAFLVVLPLFTFALVMACMAPVQYAMSSYPDGRVLITAEFTIAAGMGLWGVAAGTTLADMTLGRWPAHVRTGQLVALLLALVVMGAGAVQTARSIASQVPDARTFAEASDKRLSAVQQAMGQQIDTLAVASLNHMGGLEEISRDPSNWVNLCFSQAYALHKVVAK